MKAIEVSCRDGGRVHVAGEHVGTITVDGKPTRIFDDDHEPGSAVEGLARELVAKFGIAKARVIAALARESKAAGESLEQLVARCEAAGIQVDGKPEALVGVRQGSFGFDTTHEFLGEEFLTWLWFKWETDGGEFTLPGGRVVGIAIDDMVVFAAADADATEQTLRRGLPTRTAEARTALQQGSRVRKARLIVAEGSRQWTVTLNGGSMQFGAVKLPKDAEEVESEADRTADRAANWLALHELVAALYAKFVALRAAPEWMKTEAAAMADWMQS